MHEFFQSRSKLSYLQRLKQDLLTATMHNMLPEIAEIEAKIESYKLRQRNARRARNAKGAE